MNTSESPRFVGGIINRSLHQLFEQDERIYLLGEDLLDPYGGAFKISEGLSSDYPDRVIPTPISEESIVGMAGGMGLRGLRPVVEIMFGDFIGLAFDPLLNYISKYQGMYDGQVSCPVVIRTPMGGRRGYGPTHSQTLEKFLVGMTGLDVKAINPFTDMFGFYEEAICKGDNPTVVIENKQLYSEQIVTINDAQHDVFAVKQADGPTTTRTFSLDDFNSADVTVVCYGGMTSMALEAARKSLINHEIYAEVVALEDLSPLPMEDLIDSLKRTGRMVTVEEGTGEMAVGDYVASRVSQEGWDWLESPVTTIHADESVIPSNPQLERAVLPGKQDIINGILDVMRN